MLQTQLAASSDKVATLERLLNRDSQNSSKPPSTDTATKRREAASNRQPDGAGRRSGERRGSDGKHLRRIAGPDFVIDHVPLCCSGCGNGMDASADAGSHDRQVSDIPAQGGHHRTRRNPSSLLTPTPATRCASRPISLCHSTTTSQLEALQRLFNGNAWIPTTTGPAP